MKAVERESKTEGDVNDYVKSIGGLCLKSRPIENGYPDRQYMLPDGLAVWIEFKRRGKKPTRIQTHRLSELQERQHIAVWTDNWGDAIDFLQACVETTRLSEASDRAAAITSIRRSLPRSGTREDFRIPSRIQNP